MEDLLYEAESVRRFVGLRLCGSLPDRRSCIFATFWKRMGLGTFEEINRHLAAQGLHLREGTIMDAT